MKILISLKGNIVITYRYYFNYESKIRIQKICDYYEKYTIIRPNYSRVECSKFLFKNVKKHKKLLDLIEENENKQLENEEFEDNKKSVVYSKLIKPSFVNSNVLSLVDNQIGNDVNKQLLFNDDIGLDESCSIHFTANDVSEVYGLNRQYSSDSLYSQYNRLNTIMSNENKDFFTLRNILEEIAAKNKIIDIETKNLTDKPEDKKRLLSVNIKPNVEKQNEKEMKTINDKDKDTIYSRAQSRKTTNSKINSGTYVINKNPLSQYNTYNNPITTTKNKDLVNKNMKLFENMIKSIKKTTNNIKKPEIKINKAPLTTRQKSISKITTIENPSISNNKAYLKNNNNFIKTTTSKAKNLPNSNTLTKYLSPSNKITRSNNPSSVYNINLNLNLNLNVNMNNQDKNTILSPNTDRLPTSSHNNSIKLNNRDLNNNTREMLKTTSSKENLDNNTNENDGKMQNTPIHIHLPLTERPSLYDYNSNMSSNSNINYNGVLTACNTNTNIHSSSNNNPYFKITSKFPFASTINLSKNKIPNSNEDTFMKSATTVKTGQKLSRNVNVKNLIFFNESTQVKKPKNQLLESQSQKFHQSARTNSINITKSPMASIVSPKANTNLNSINERMIKTNYGQLYKKFVNNYTSSQNVPTSKNKANVADNNTNSNSNTNTIGRQYNSINTQKTTYKNTLLNSIGEKKPLSIHLNNYKFESLNSMNKKVPLTSRNEKGEKYEKEYASVKIFKK